MVGLKLFQVGKSFPLFLLARVFSELSDKYLEGALVPQHCSAAKFSLMHGRMGVGSGGDGRKIGE